MGLLIVVAIVGLCWAMIMPPFQSPDAFTHYSYIESLATRFALPGRPGHNEESTNVRAAYRAAGVLALQWSSPEAKPSWSPRAAAAYRAAATRLPRSDGAGTTPAQSNPPIYYALATLPYLATVGGNALDRIQSIQLVGILLLLATTAGAWALAGEVFGRRPLLQLTTGAIAGLTPMASFMSTSVNPDALLIMLWTLWLWLGARTIRRGARGGDLIALAIVTAGAILTKATAYALLPALLLLLVLAWRARRRTGERRWRTAALLAAVALTVYLPVQAWIVGLRTTGRPTLAVGPPTPHSSAFFTRLFDYVWQFYLPRLSGQPAIRVPTLPSLPWPRQLPGLPLWNVWVREGWGVFGWVDIYMPGWIYVLLAVLTAVVAVAAVVICTRFRDRTRLKLLAVFVVTFLSLLAVLHEIEFQSLTAGTGAFAQGRYLLPVIALFGLAVALVGSRLPARARGSATAVLMVGLLALQIVALATVARTYYT